MGNFPHNETLFKYTILKSFMVVHLLSSLKYFILLASRLPNSLLFLYSHHPTQSFAGSSSSSLPVNVMVSTGFSPWMLPFLLRYLGNLILFHGFQYFLYTVNILIYICSLKLSIFLQTFICNYLIGIVTHLS